MLCPACPHAWCSDSTTIALLCRMLASLVPLQELRILEMIPFDNTVVKLYSSCTLDNNIVLVLEFMEVSSPFSRNVRLLQLCTTV